MEFEVLKKSHLKRNILIGVLIVGIIAAIILNFTRAKYRVTESIPLVTGTINYSPYDIHVSTKLLVGEDEYIDLDSIPTSTNVSLMSSSCTNNAILSWNSANNGYEISNLTHKGTKCEAIYAISGGESTDFDYTGNIQEFIAPEDGNYLLEVWGAQGGNTTGYIGGYGSYSKGIVTLDQNDILYIGVGGKGGDNCVAIGCTGGYNGGGNGGTPTNDYGNYQTGGGGATHIATANGLLSTLSNNLDSILIVAGGGSGSYYHVYGADYSSNGASGGGFQGNDGEISAYGMDAGGGGTQTAGGTAGYRGSAGSFGQGGSGPDGTVDSGASGGGGGFYGGGAAGHSSPGGGSGYIGNTLLSDKAMYCYNCTTSSDSSTLTYSINNVSSNPVSNSAKEGNGYAKITLLDYHAYQPEFGMSVETSGTNITITVTPSENNLFNISKYYYTVNDEYIESDGNTYTFEDLEERKYEVKVYVIDEKNLTSEVKTENINVSSGITAQDIIASKKLATRTDFSTALEADTTGTIYYADTSKGRTYYFAGNPSDNWVRFGGFYWRIIRINEDGSIRLIYSGNSTSGPVTIGESTQIGTSAFNSTYDNNMYVGYMYDTNQLHGFKTSSTMKTYLDEWYSENLLQFSNKIDGNAGFCGDRTTYSGSGIGNVETIYSGSNRLSINKNPTFDCKDLNDLYTVNGSENGNGALTYPIGLITADELSYAGGIEETDRSIYYYLRTNNRYWTMTPQSYSYLGYSYTSVFLVDTYGGFRGGMNVDIVGNEWGVRPVINLKANTNFVIDGTGTSTNPYVVIGAE